jgi:hypothetical protein
VLAVVGWDNYENGHVFSASTINDDSSYLSQFSSRDGIVSMFANPGA